MEFYKTQTVLTDEAVADVVEQATEAYLRSASKRAMQQSKFRLALEELLLQFRDCYGQDAVCRISGVRRGRKYSIVLTAPGPRREWMPFEEEEMRFSYNLLQRLGVSPQYSYSAVGKGRNRVCWELPAAKPKNTLVFSLAVAAVLAVFAGLLVNALPPATHDAVMQGVLTPFFNKFIAIISEVATPLVFFAVISGILGIGDINAFGKIGSKMLTRMMGNYGIAAVLLGIVGVVGYGVVMSSTGAGGGSAIQETVQLVLDIIPENLIQPFSIDNDLQVIALAVFIGVVLLLLGDTVPRLVELIQNCATLVNKMMTLCCKLLPAVVFCGVMNLICTSNAEQFISIGKMALVYLPGGLMLVLITILRTLAVTKVPLRCILPKQLPALLINITTSSQVAALPAHMTCCKDGFGIDQKLVDFGLPLGIVIYMPAGAIYLGVSAWALCTLYGGTISVSMMIRILLISVIVAIASPPIPGAALVIQPIFFLTCGIPNEAFPLAIIFGTIVGYVMPAFNGFLLQLELLMTAKKLGKLDESKLRQTAKTGSAQQV